MISPSSADNLLRSIKEYFYVIVGDNMINIKTKEYDSRYNFVVNRVSYIGNPKNNSLMFIGPKLTMHLKRLYSVKDCIVIADQRMDIPEELERQHCFILVDNPAYEYARIVKPFWDKKIEDNKKRKYKLAVEGYKIGETVKLGNNVHIEEDCFIDHDCVIGDNTVILTGATLRNNVKVGKNCIIKEKAVIGSSGFTFTHDPEGNNYRIPSWGGVNIGDDVEIGTYVTVCSGTASPTTILNNVKIDDHVHVGHDVIIGKNTIITAGVVIGGYVEIGKKVYIGIGANLKNRISIGDNSIIGMAARVYKNVHANTTMMNEAAMPINELANRIRLINRIKKMK